MTTGTTVQPTSDSARVGVAAMEPRRDDGDDLAYDQATHLFFWRPQWSPVVTTGTTSSDFTRHRQA